jgi:exonuclease VII small subunit
MLKLYKEGIKLSKFCFDKLNKAEEEVMSLTKTLDGFELSSFEEV